MKKVIYSSLGLVAAIAFMAVVVTAPPAAADLPFETYFATFQQGVDGYTGTDDTWLQIRYERGDRNAGGMQSMRTSGHANAGQNRREALLKFDNVFGAGGVPAGLTADDIISATVTMSVYRGTELDPPRGLRIYAFITPWEAGDKNNAEATEGESTANHRFHREDGVYAPEDYWGTDGEQNIFPTMDDVSHVVGELSYTAMLDEWFGAEGMSEGEFGEDAWQAELDVTLAVKGWLDGSIENHGFLFRSHGGTWQTYDMYSSLYEGNAEWRPKLTIEYIPEPSSLLLLGAGSLLALMRRRR